MSTQAILPVPSTENTLGARRTPGRSSKKPAFPLPFRAPAHPDFEVGANHHAELFYLQKQIQAQTPMVIVLEDGEQIEGLIEWYDRHSIKIRGRVKALVYKSAIKYMYKVGDFGK